MKKGKRILKAKDLVDKAKLYDIETAVDLVKKTATAKFDESVEAHIRLNIDPTKGDQAIRGSVVLPHGTGNEVRIGVIVNDDKILGDEKVDVVGGEDLIKKIKAGNVPEVDVIVTTPDMMPKLASAAKVLGPRGLMPSPKTGTVTTNVVDVIKELKKGKNSFKNDKTGNVHQIIGKASFDKKQLIENFEAFLNAVSAQKNEAHKGKLIKSVSICSTMGPGIKVKA